jgi:hypothetical protein
MNPSDEPVGDDQTAAATACSAPERWKRVGLKKAKTRYPEGRERLALLAVVGLLSLGALYLGVMDFGYAHTLGDKFGAATWLIASASGAAACVNLICKMGSWLLLAQLNAALSLFVAISVIAADFQTPLRDYLVIAVSTAVVLVTIVLLYVLWRYVRPAHMSRFGTVTTAVLGITGALLTLATTWYTTEYLPQTSLPKVDLNTELKEVGRDGDVVHLSATITVHNKGTLTVRTTASLMRVVGYPRGTVLEPPSSENTGAAIDFDYPASEEYRLDAVDFAHRRLLYSDDFITTGGVLQPDATVVYQRVIDVDSKKYPRVRLNVTASFLNDSYSTKIESCAAPPDTPIVNDDPRWYGAVAAVRPRQVLEPSGLGKNKLVTLCMDRYLEPRNVTGLLVGDRPMMRTTYVLQSPCRYLPHDQAAPVATEEDLDNLCRVEVPYCYTVLWSRDKHGLQPNFTPLFSAAYPNVTLLRSAEWVLIPEQEQVGTAVIDSAGE